MTIECRVVDFTDPQQADALVNLLDDYATDPMGGGQALSAETRQNLASALAKRHEALSVIVYVDGEPAGLANCFETFSTFKCRPLLNIHDLAVSRRFRGQGLAKVLLNKIESIARERNCCKLTLEVLEGNKVAQNAYLKFGFDGYQLDPELGQALFWEKPLK